MWCLRVLNGPQAGQIFNLKNGKNIIGRSSQVDVKIMAQGVSKNHCILSVESNGISLTDQNSSNGTYINGVRIQSAQLKIGDKFAVHDVVLEVVPVGQAKLQQPHYSQSGHSLTTHTAGYYTQSAAPQIYGHSNQGHPSLQPHLSIVQEDKMNSASNDNKDLKSKIEDYINKVVLPGVYKLAQLFDFKIVLAGFVAVFVFSVTLFSLFPMIAVSQDSIQLEAKKRVMSLARALAETNRRALGENAISSLSTFSIEREDGVKEAIIVSRSDGSILAPTSRVGRNSESVFVDEVLRSSREIVRRIDGSLLGASFPIMKFDPDRQEEVPLAYAVVIYDAEVLAMEDGILVNLFMKNLIISMCFGSVLFFLLFKLIEFPISSLNKQLDQAMREKTDQIENTFKFAPLQALAGNISSLLTRVGQPQNSTGPTQSKEFEASMIIQHFRDPAFAVSPEKRILNANSNFESLAQNSLENLMNQGISAIVDPSLKQNIEILINEAVSGFTQIHQRELDLGRGAIEIRCHAIMSGSEVGYFLFTVVPKKDES